MPYCLEETANPHRQLLHHNDNQETVTLEETLILPSLKPNIKQNTTTEHASLLPPYLDIVLDKLTENIYK
jgi:hypothetical protein